MQGNSSAGPVVRGDLEALGRREWLETNGIGGYASSTVPGLDTRRYHGLLVAALHPPVGRMVLLSKLEETLIVNGVRFELTTNRYPGAVHPEGYGFLRDFRLDPFPVTVFEAGGVEIEKRVFMVDGENTTVVQYDIRSLDSSPPAEWILEIRPLIAFRDYSTTRGNRDLNPDVVIETGLAAVTPYAGLPRCTWRMVTRKWRRPGIGTTTSNMRSIVIAGLRTGTICSTPSLPAST